MLRYEAMLRAYMAHVWWEEGTTFANSWDRDALIEEGVTGEEADKIIAIAEEVYRDINKRGS